MRNFHTNIFKFSDIKKTVYMLGVVTLGLTCFLGQSFADVIELEGGEVMRGAILEQDDEHVFFQTHKGHMLNFPLGQIDRINGVVVSNEKESAPEPEEKKTFLKRFEDEPVEAIRIPRRQVDAAYRAIPHKQTTFNASRTKIKSAEARVLDDFFEMVDQAVVARVETLEWFRSGGTRGRSYRKYAELAENVLARLKQLEEPARLKEVKQLVYESVQEQKQYFKEWSAADSRGKNFALAVGQDGWQNHPQVSSSHTKLVQAYNKLMKIYPKENAKNHEAFFDHLCALDFV